MTARPLFFTLFLLFVALFSYGIRVSGIVIDSQTNEPIPFVNIWFANTNIGTISDVDGKFMLRVDTCTTIQFSSVGYIPQSRKLDLGSIDYVWEVRMESDVQTLSEINIKPDYSYDEEMFRKVISHKKENDKNLTSIKKYGNYDRTTVLLASDKDSKLQKRIKIPDEAMIKSPNNVSLLPVYYSELLKNTTQGDDLEVDIVSSSKDGILPNLNEQIENIILEKIAIDFNFYKNQITILERGFISPLSNLALLYYNIYITDSIMCDDIKHYKFSFYPKNKHAVVFKGHFWAEDGSFALTSISATLPSEANINFIEELNVSIIYEKQEDGTWFYKDQKMNVNFSMTKNTSLNIEDNQLNNVPEGGAFLVNRSLQYFLPKDTLKAQGNTVANEPSLNSYSDIEDKTKQGVQILKQNKRIKAFDKLSGMIMSGYYPLGLFDIGPLFDFYTTNQFEGNRFTLPIRTGEALFKNFTVGGYLGYGTKNQKFKYGLSSAYMLPFKTRTVLSAQYTDDYSLASRSQYLQFIQENPYNKGNGNFISALTSKYRNAFVFQQKRFEMKLETDLSKNTGLSINPYYNRNYSSEFLKFKVNHVDIGRYDNLGMLINFRFAFDRNYDEVYFARIYYGNAKPVINASFDLGRINNLEEKTNSNHFYALSNVSIKHKFSLGQVFIRYLINAGYMIGDVPYNLLEKPSGTNSLGYSLYAFNLLDYASFAHNLYTNAHVNINGGGIVFNHLPLLSNWKLREIVSLKYHYGARTSQLTNTIEIPEFYSHRQKGPYAELGLGATNIFKFLRVEYVHVLGDKHQIGRYSMKHGIRMRFEVMF